MNKQKIKTIVTDPGFWAIVAFVAYVVASIYYMRPI